MPRKTYFPEEIIAKLRQADVLLGEGKKIPEVIMELEKGDFVLPDTTTRPVRVVEARRIARPRAAISAAAASGSISVATDLRRPRLRRSTVSRERPRRSALQETTVRRWGPGLRPAMGVRSGSTDQVMIRSMMAAAARMTNGAEKRRTPPRPKGGAGSSAPRDTLHSSRTFIIG
jgi:hypothetical protein